jgi:hypothetical protein
MGLPGNAMRFITGTEEAPAPTDQSKERCEYEAEKSTLQEILRSRRDLLLPEVHTC